MEFDYVVAGTTFSFQVFWLKMHRLLIIKIFLDVDVMQVGSQRNMRHRKLSKVLYEPSGIHSLGNHGDTLGSMHMIRRHRPVLWYLQRFDSTDSAGR